MRVVLNKGLLSGCCWVPVSFYLWILLEQHLQRPNEFLVAKPTVSDTEGLNSVELCTEVAKNVNAYHTVCTLYRYMLSFVLCIFVVRQHANTRYWYRNSVCLSVHLSVTSRIVAKQLSISSQFLHHTVVQSSSFKHLRESPTGSPLLGALNTVEV